MTNAAPAALRGLDDISPMAPASRLSQAALGLGSWSAWQAARVEAQQDERSGRRWHQRWRLS